MNWRIDMIKSKYLLDPKIGPFQRVKMQKTQELPGALAPWTPAKVSPLDPTKGP